MKRTKMCNKCKKELPMTTEYFHKDKDKKDGFHTICKDCRRGKPKEVDNTPEGFIKCTKCENILPATSEYFHRDKYNKKYGLRRRCKDCSTKNGRNYVPGKDLRGQRFGRLLAIEPTDKRDGSNIIWKMKCDCGNITYASTGNLGQGHTKSCGCWQKEWASKNAAQVGKNSAIDLTGKKFNRLTALEATERRRSNGVVWKCRCDCGNITYVDTSGLQNGYTKSCGCLTIETSKENAIDITGQKFGMLTAIKPTKRRVNRNVYWKVKCDCGNYSSVSATSLMSNNIKSCGCLFDKMKGENHPRYDPTITDEERIKNRYILGKEHTDNWRIDVYERDNFTCQVCGDKGRKGHQLMLNAHHLDGWNWCKDKRFKTSNGITLCEDCHVEFHKEYGYGNNTREQFEEFKEFRELENII